MHKSITTSEQKKRFYNSLRNGTGDAYLIIKENPAIDFSALLLKGAIKNYAYDQQAEGSRATYINSMIKITRNRVELESAILAALEIHKGDDDYNLDQLCDLAVLFHKSGNKSARSSLYKRFMKNGKRGYEICGLSQIIEIDALSGFMRVAEFVGKRILARKEPWDDHWRVEDFQQNNNKIDINRELKKASRTNKYVKAYLESVIATSQKELTSNYKKEVKNLLKEMAATTNSSERAHFLALKFVEIYSANHTPECKEPLEIVYNKINCGIHRKQIIEILEDNGVLSEKILSELKYDSYGGVRSLYQRIRKERKKLS